MKLKLTMIWYEHNLYGTGKNLKLFLRDISFESGWNLNHWNHRNTWNTAGNNTSETTAETAIETAIMTMEIELHSTQAHRGLGTLWTF